MKTVRELDGITYRVIDEPDAIARFVGSVLKEEWEADLRDEGKDPATDRWLADMLRRSWRLRVLATAEVSPDTDRVPSGYLGSERFRQRKARLRSSLEVVGSVIWPVTVRSEGRLLADGYCRFTALREMGVTRLYAYLGTRMAEAPWGPGLC